MEIPTITLLSFSHFRKEFLEKIADAVMHELQCNTVVREVHFDLSVFFDASRRQYNGNQLLHEVDMLEVPEGKVIGLFNIDLFIPILTYIFGQAHLGGRTAIASLYRLHNERYGLAPDESLLFERFRKEVLHELGHTFGLIHCHTPTCVMRSSTYVEDIDQKDAAFCSNCREMLSWLT